MFWRIQFFGVKNFIDVKNAFFGVKNIGVKNFGVQKSAPYESYGMINC